MVLHVNFMRLFKHNDSCMKNFVFITSRSDVRLVAVSSRHNPVLVDQGASTEVVARVQRHLMWLGVGFALIPSDDLVVLRGN